MRPHPIHVVLVPFAVPLIAPSGGIVRASLHLGDVCLVLGYEQVTQGLDVRVNRVRHDPSPNRSSSLPSLYLLFSISRRKKHHARLILLDEEPSPFDVLVQLDPVELILLSSIIHSHEPPQADQPRRLRSHRGTTKSRTERREP
jgi:hypothetical protein